MHNNPVANVSPRPYYNTGASPWPTCYPNYWANPYYPNYPTSTASPTSSMSMPQPFVPPMAEDSSPFFLCFITGNISKCTGCGNKYVKPLVAPHDLCVQHREWRYFTSPGHSDQQSKYSPAYYHLNLPCIQKKWPTFKKSDLIIQVEVAAKMTEVHKNHPWFF